VAPVALYPDPLLALVLQAAVQPVQVVQAERFLDKREKDPKLTPNADWDPGVLGLLNYPDLIRSMSEHLDWTEALGEVVAEDLGAVQDAIQAIRSSAYTQGFLASDERQKVVLKDGFVLILPADAKTISVPKYDPEALLAAVTPVEAAETTEALQVEAPVAPAPAVAEAPAVEAAPAPAPAAPAMAEAPAYAPAPAPVAYAAPPPTVAYAAPQSSFWSSAATFAGGAVMGGVLGYALNDDDDDDDDDDWDGYERIDDDRWDDLMDQLDDEDRPLRRPGINVEDSTIVVGGDRYSRDKVQARLREGSTVARSGRVEAAKGLAPVRVRSDAAKPAVSPVRPPRREVRLPGARQEGGARQTRAQRGQAASQRTTVAQGRQGGLTSGLQGARTAAKERDRGAVSREIAKTRPAGGAQVARNDRSREKAAHAVQAGRSRQPVAQRPQFRSGGDRKPLGGYERGDRVKREASRGRGSAAKAKGHRRG
jgi:hypothetical protein